MKEILERITDYENEQVLRNKKYKCMKQLEQMIQDNELIKTQLKCMIILHTAILNN